MIQAERDQASSALTVSNLTVRFKHQLVLENISVSIPMGSLTAIIGPNGAGKSTLVNTIAGLIRPDNGSVKLHVSLGEPFKEIAFVPQSKAVDWSFPLRVIDVVQMGRYPQRGLFQKYTEDDSRIVMGALEKTNITDLAQRPISDLSGGQKQRVFIARALAQQAKILLLDEPFAGIDATNTQHLFVLFKALVQCGYTILIVHHDLRTIFENFTWAVLLNKRCVASGPLEQVITKKNLRELYQEALFPFEYMV